MKKILFSLVALMSILTLQAQSICGSWQMMQPKVNTHEDGSYETISGIDTYNEDGTFVSYADVTLSSKPSRTKEREMALSLSVKGTYTLEGDKLVVKYDPNSLTMELVSISENGKVVESPELKSDVNAALKDKLNAKSAMIKKSLKNETYTVKVNGSMLQLTDKDGKVEQLMRISNIKR